MNAELEERIWAYLDGLLSPVEIEAFERDMLRPEVSQAFAEALLLRELVRGIGPSEAPDELVRAAQRAVLRDLDGEAPPRFSRSRAALGGLTWAVRGPQRAVAGSLSSTRDALSEIGNTRYTLGPLARRDQPREVVERTTRRRRWWRLLLRRKA